MPVPTSFRGKSLPSLPAERTPASSCSAPPTGRDNWTRRERIATWAAKRRRPKSNHYQPPSRKLTTAAFENKEDRRRTDRRASTKTTREHGNRGLATKRDAAQTRHLCRVDNRREELWPGPRIRGGRSCNGMADLKRAAK